MKDHKDLDVWKSAIDLVMGIYEATALFPREELFGLITQMRRAAVSIPSNISEGAARQTGKEFIQFLFIALGSASELETQLIIANKLNLFDKSIYPDLENDIKSIRILILGLVRSLKEPE